MSINRPALISIGDMIFGSHARNNNIDVVKVVLVHAPECAA